LLRGVTGRRCRSDLESARLLALQVLATDWQRERGCLDGCMNGESDVFDTE